jgi:hypothetical protein
MFNVLAFSGVSVVPYLETGPRPEFEPCSERLQASLQH